MPTIKGCFSRTQSILLDVPQASVVGPLLFPFGFAFFCNNRDSQHEKPPSKNFLKILLNANFRNPKVTALPPSPPRRIRLRVTAAAFWKQKQNCSPPGCPAGRFFWNSRQRGARVTRDERESVSSFRKTVARCYRQRKVSGSYFGWLVEFVGEFSSAAIENVLFVLFRCRRVHYRSNEKSLHTIFRIAEGQVFALDVTSQDCCANFWWNARVWSCFQEQVQTKENLVGAAQKSAALTFDWRDYIFKFLCWKLIPFTFRSESLAFQFTFNNDFQNRLLIS